MIYLKQTNLLAKMFMLLAVLVVGMAVFAPAKATQPEFGVVMLKVVTENGEFTFNTEVAISVMQRQKGLMYRREIAPNHAMLFRWKTPQPVSMWMKDTYVSLDMVFIRADGQVANIGRSTTPLSLMPVSSYGNVSAVLEVVAGTAEKIGLKAGDYIMLPALK